ncbi:hypothetical protein [Aquisediminimonas profunda]|uniref:hypothetical protein n=1 Tax=Aquisediminimonas profunda TaxID=1550733 RepID=UPI001FEAF201|nr:hypothetical protein [Aquisediminimonas profunda]
MPTILCVHVVPHFGDVATTMSPGLGLKFVQLRESDVQSRKSRIGPLTSIFSPNALATDYVSEAGINLQYKRIE